MRSKPVSTDPVVAVIGTGSIGRRHIENLLALGARPIACSRTSNREWLSKEGVRIVATNDCDSAIEMADAVVIATPTDEHLTFALRAARAGKALFIEKPLSHDLEGVPELEAIAKHLVVEVGCQLRAHPGLQLLKKMLTEGRDGPVLAFRGCVGQRLDQWRPDSDYRTSYSANRNRGGGALFDLVHEVDLAVWLCGRVIEVCAKLSRVSDLEIDADDLANLILAMEYGACGSLQLDMISPVFRRNFEVVCQHANYEWNYVEGWVKRTHKDGVEFIYRAGAGFERNQLFHAHMRHFLARVGGEERPALCSLEDGIVDMHVLVAAKESARSGKCMPVKLEPK